jgi:TonB-linked SusC/RagA family outer membrane protein
VVCHYPFFFDFVALEKIKLIISMKNIVLLALCLSMAFSHTWAQATRTVTGKVTDAQGTPVSAAAVQAKGTRVGTTTANDGTFRLNVPQNVTVLVISSLGFTEQEVNIASQSNVTVSLVASNDVQLSEVVVTVPYGTVKKTAFTGSEATVTAKQIEKQQVTSVTRALEGLVPGLQATSGGGAPGTGAALMLRGPGSLQASTSPAIILNGVFYDGPVSAIPTDEIESITVLKDASAAALYGSRAGNGVIMITTKRGKKGRAAVQATVRQGFMSRGIPEYDKVGAKDYYELNWEATRNSFQYGSGQSAAVAGQTASAILTGSSALVYNAYNVPGNQLVDPVTGKLNPNAQLKWNESWEDALFRTASRTNANIIISGAGDKSDYLISFGYLNEEGTVKYTGYKRYSARLNVNTTATSWLNTGLQLDGAFADRRQALGEGGGTSGTGPFYFSRTMGPIYPVYEYNPTTGAPIGFDANTGTQKLDWGGNGSAMGTRPYLGNTNPLGALILDDRSTKTASINANSYMEVKFLKDFSFKTTLGLNLWDDNQTTYQNPLYGDAADNPTTPGNDGGRSTKTNDRQLSYTFNQVLSWNHSFSKHNVRALVGHENYYYKYNYVSGFMSGFSFQGQTELNNGTTATGNPSSNTINHRIESYFGGINYDYNSRYLLSGSVRTDGSSRFAQPIRWGTFYSAGAGWRLSQEEFLKNVSWISELKFKVSYGESGNENLGTNNDQLYPYKLWYYSDGNGAYQLPSNAPNADLKWEGNKIFNTGFDFSLFKNRLQGSIEYFNRVSSDLLFNVPLAISSPGFGFRLENVGTVKNYGVEVQLGYNAIRKRNFDWRVDVNVTSYRNTVTDLNYAKFNEAGIVSGSKKLLPGRSVFDFYLREYAGVDAATGDALYYKDVLDANGKATGERNLTNDWGKATQYYVGGSSLPKFSGGLTNSIRYKNFDLSVLLTFSYGGKFYDLNYASLMHQGTYGNAWHTDILRRWQKPGDVTEVPRVEANITANDAGSTRWLFDGSYLNIKNITLSYTVPKTAVTRLGIQSVSVFGNVDNVHVFSAKKGMDPQINFNGVAVQGYPPFRTVTFGLNVNL